MFHCPECGEMVIAGMAHPPTLDEKEVNDYFDGKYEELRQYVYKHAPKSSGDAFFNIVENMTNLRGVMMEIWLRAEHVFREEQGEPF